MAKKTVATLQTGGGKNHTKVIKMVKNNAGSYSFREEIVTNDKVSDFFKEEK
jgi:hypothetical protein